MESLGCNVNMMDGRGVIIASGEPDRIGKLHVGACLVLERKETVQCFDTTDAGAESTQPGINMPLCHAGEVVGVVGVTGDPHQLEHMARLVKLTAELLMEQEFANDQKLSDQTAKTSYVNRLISLASPQDAQSVRLWAERHGYDMDQPRAVCLLAAQPLAGRRRPASMHDAVLRSVERMPGFSAQDIAAYLGGKQVVLLKTAPVGRTRQARAELERFLKLCVRTAFHRESLYVWPAAVWLRRWSVFRKALRKPGS